MLEDNGKCLDWEDSIMVMEDDGLFCRRENMILQWLK